MNVLVIGATSGIGRELCARYASEGHRVIATGRRKELLDELVGEHSNISSAIMDVVDLENTKQTIDSLWKLAIRIDVAIVCAGVGDLNPELLFEKELPTINTNVLGWTNIVDCLYSKFDEQNSGHLVVITSIGGLRGEPVAPAYSASKAFQINYVEAISKKAHKDRKNIAVTDIRPGLVDTAMAKGDGLFWVMPVEKVVTQIMKAIKKKKRVVVVTKRWAFLAFIQKHLPWFLYKNM